MTNEKCSQLLECLTAELDKTLTDFTIGCIEMRKGDAETIIDPRFDNDCEEFLSKSLTILTKASNQSLTTVEVRGRTFVKVDTMNDGGLHDGFISWKLSEECYAFGFKTPSGRVRYVQCEGEGAVTLSSEENIDEGQADVEDKRKFIISQPTLKSGWCIQPYMLSDDSVYIIPGTRDILAAKMLSKDNASLWNIDE